MIRISFNAGCSITCFRMENIMNQYTFEEITTGLSHSFTVTMTEEKHNMFTMLSGDENPMHMDEEYAKAHGYEHKLVYGMATASLYSTLVGMYLPGEHCIFHEVDTKFNAPVYIGDTLTVEGTVKEIHELFKRVKIKATIRNQDGVKVSSASLTVGVNE